MKSSTPHTPPAGAVVAMLALADMAPSPTNPRKHVSSEYIKGLAATIKQHGVIQPITVRPNPRGMPIYEIVVGFCRWKASQEAGKDDIPAFWRKLDDKQVLELQVIENLQREDVHPLEEAEGYQRLMKDHGYTADTLGDKVGKSKAYIYARLKLLALCGPAQKAFYDGGLNPSTALLVARIPDEKLQIQATKEIAHGMYNQGPMSVRNAEEHVQRHYMLKLNEAPFSRTDDTLLTAAGCCDKCPKRTGNQVDLFTDVKNADVCTDPPCYQAKKEAHIKRQQELAKAEGRKIIAGKEAEKIKPNSYGDLNGGYVDLDKKIYFDGKHKSVREVLGKDAPAADILMDPHHKGEMIEVVSKATLKEKLEAKGTKAATAALETLSPSRGGGKSDADKAAERKRKRDITFRQRLFEQIRSHLLVECEQNDTAPYLEPEEEVLVASAFFERSTWEDQKRVAKLWMGPSEEKQEDSALVHEFRKRITAFPRKDLARLMIDLTIVCELTIPGYSSDDTPDRMLAIAKPMLIDVDAMKQQIIAEAREAEKPKGKAKTVKAKVEKLSPVSMPASVAAKMDDSGPLNIGDSVKIKDNVKSPLGAAYKGRKGKITGTVGKAFMVRIDNSGSSTSYYPDELEKLPAAISAENSKPASSPTEAALAGEDSAATPAAPATGSKAKAAAKTKAKAKTTPAPTSSANEPAKTTEGKAAASTTPVKDQPLSPENPGRLAWPFPIGNRPSAS